MVLGESIPDLARDISKVTTSRVDLLAREGDAGGGACWTRSLLEWEIYSSH